MLLHRGSLVYFFTQELIFQGLYHIYIVACQVHPALVKRSRVTRFYVNVSRLVHLKGSRTVSGRRRGDRFYWRPRLPGTQHYILYHIPNQWIVTPGLNSSLFYFKNSKKKMLQHSTLHYITLHAKKDPNTVVKYIHFQVNGITHVMSYRRCWSCAHYVEIVSRSVWRHSL